MKSATILLTLGVLTLAPAASFAQDKAMEGMAMSEEQATLPKACDEAAGSTDMSKMMTDMEGMMSGDGMGDVEKANMGAMMKMHGPMMKAAMIKDPDLAFNCGMIAHHQGAIAMSEIVLKMGKDDESKKMAQMIIDAQKKEIAEMTKWVEDHAK